MKRTLTTASLFSVAILAGGYMSWGQRVAPPVIVPPVTVPPIVVPPVSPGGGGPPTPPYTPPVLTPPTPVVPGPPPPSRTNWVPVLIPPDCFQLNNLCRTLQAVEFINGMNDLFTGNDVVGNITNWTDDVTGRRPVVVTLPALTVDRAEVIKQIFRLQLKAANTVAAKLRSDIQRLKPFPNDTPAETQRKRDYVQEEDARARRVERQSQADTEREAQRWESSRSNSVQPKLGEAFQQLVYSSKTGVGIPRKW